MILAFSKKYWPFFVGYVGHILTIGGLAESIVEIRGSFRQIIDEYRTLVEPIVHFVNQRLPLHYGQYEVDIIASAAIMIVLMSTAMATKIANFYHRLISLAILFLVSCTISLPFVIVMGMEHEMESQRPLILLVLFNFAYPAIYFLATGRLTGNPHWYDLAKIYCNYIFFLAIGAFVAIQVSNGFSVSLTEAG